MHLIDSHCHFDFLQFDKDRETVWNNIKSLGIKNIIIPGVVPDQWQQARQLSQYYKGMFYAAGLHPWWIKQWVQEKNTNQKKTQQDNEIFEHKLEVLMLSEIKNSLCIAIGECGLDKNIPLDYNIQLRIFDLHCKLAVTSLLPIIVHNVKSHNEILFKLKKYKMRRAGVIHGFSGSYEMAMQYWKLGFYLGIGGTITYDRAKKTQDAVKRLPIESMILETDSPDMPLQGCQGKRNSPENLIKIAHKLASLRNQSIESIVLSTTNNTKELFAL